MRLWCICPRLSSFAYLKFDVGRSMFDVRPFAVIYAFRSALCSMHLAPCTLFLAPYAISPFIFQAFNPITSINYPLGPPSFFHFLPFTSILYLPPRFMCFIPRLVPFYPHIKMTINPLKNDPSSINDYNQDK